jgi:hypothetical protein
LFSHRVGAKHAQEAENQQSGVVVANQIVIERATLAETDLLIEIHEVVARGRIYQERVRASLPLVMGVNDPSALPIS